MTESSVSSKVQDDLCCVAQGYLKHGSADRALVFLLLALKLQDPSRRLLLLLGKCFLRLGNIEQADIVIERYRKAYGHDDAYSFLQRLLDVKSREQANQRKAG